MSKGESVFSATHAARNATSNSCQVYKSNNDLFILSE